MKPPNKFTYAQLCACAERELRLRRRVYPNRVDTGRMTSEQAGRELAMMAAIGEVLEELAARERLL